MDKVQKIREEIEKRYEYWREKEFNSHSIESEIRMSECQHLLLMLNSPQKESISEDLEEEITDYINKHYHIRYDETLDVGNDSINSYDFADAARHFANWQKEQMMAKAVDAEILEIPDNDYSICEHTHLELFVEPSTLEKKGFKENDKVKVIVIKEE